MKLSMRTLACAITVLLATACTNTPSSIWQNGPVIALQNGLYDGITEVQEVRQHGQNGVFAFDQLDGEGLVLDGVFYLIQADGRVSILTDEDKVAWTTISPFQLESVISLPANTTESNISERVDPQLETLNSYYAIKIVGDFSQLTTRTFKKQSKPYPPLCQAVAEQITFDFENVSGTIVGFRSPKFSDGISVANWHFHFISEDKQSGGHVLSFTLPSGELQLDKIDHFNLQVPKNATYNSADLKQTEICN